jgi:hypothetical protein
VGERSPIYGVTIPAGYQQWELAAPSHDAAAPTSYGPLSEADDVQQHFLHGTPDDGVRGLGEGR